LENEKYKEALIKSLERGNLQSATFHINGEDQKIFITPNLTFKTLNAYNPSMQKISLSELMQKNKQEQMNKQEAKEEVSEKQQVKKQSKINNDDGNASAKKTRKRQKIA
jgi:hypothetical protein